MMTYQSSLYISLQFSIILLMFGCKSTDQKIIYVDSNSSTTGDGKTWISAYKDLQDALDDALQGDEIWVAAGTYKPTKKTGGNEDRHRSFYLKNGISIYGGFIGTETDREQRDWNNHETILSGDLRGNDIEFNNTEESSCHAVIGNKTDNIVRTIL